MKVALPSTFRVQHPGRHEFMMVAPVTYDGRVGPEPVLAGCRPLACAAYASLLARATVTVDATAAGKAGWTWAAVTFVAK